MRIHRAGRRGLARGLALLSAASLMGASLAACEQAEPEPQNEQTGAMMPDTSQPVATPPDAARTGVVPEEGAVPVQPSPPAAQPGAAYAPDVPVDVPDVEPRT